MIEGWNPGEYGHSVSQVYSFKKLLNDAWSLVKQVGNVTYNAIEIEVSGGHGLAVISKYNNIGYEIGRYIETFSVKLDNGKSTSSNPRITDSAALSFGPMNLGYRNTHSADGISPIDQSNNFSWYQFDSSIGETVGFFLGGIGFKIDIRFNLEEFFNGLLSIRLYD